MNRRSAFIKANNIINECESNTRLELTKMVNKANGTYEGSYARCSDIVSIYEYIMDHHSTLSFENGSFHKTSCRKARELIGDPKCSDELRDVLTLYLRLYGTVKPSYFDEA